jgi:hypothetical protein
MSLFVVKLTFTPLFILAASFAGRRWGDAVGGWLVGLPLTSGPVALFLALEQGPDFAAQASAGSLAGTAAQACFCMAYGLSSAFGWPLALLGGIAAFAGCASLLQLAGLPHLTLLIIALAFLTLTLRVLPPRKATRMSRSPFPWWDMPARMTLVTLLVVALTSFASVLGARVSGVLAAFPVFVTVLAIFAHRMQGPIAAVEVVRGMATGLFGFVAFFYVISLALARTGVPVAFACATLSAVLVQAATFNFIRRPIAQAAE